nr:MAG TPA: hypothetical protein [Caudoviricetes sp.]
MKKIGYTKFNQLISNKLRKVFCICTRRKMA